MKKKKDYTLTSLLVPFLIAVLFEYGCSQESKKECGNLRSYQIETYNDSTVIYDGNRKVGVIPYNKNSSLDSLINLDNL